jgi:flagellar basal body P-ring formation protein FlgA
VRLSVLALLVAIAFASPAAAQTASIPVAARDLPRGVALAAADIASADPAAASRVGWVTRRVIREGEPLREPAVSPPLLVSAGDEVQVVWSDGALELRVKGRATNSATAGGRVSVRVDTTRRFEGVAVGAGLVRIDSSARSR